MEIEHGIKILVRKVHEDSWLIKDYWLISVKPPKYLKLGDTLETLLAKDLHDAMSRLLERIAALEDLAQAWQTEVMPKMYSNGIYELWNYLTAFINQLDVSNLESHWDEWADGDNNDEVYYIVGHLHGYLNTRRISFEEYRETESQF